MHWIDSRPFAAGLPVLGIEAKFTCGSSATRCIPASAGCCERASFSAALFHAVAGPREPAISQQEIAQGKKHVVANVGNVVMAHRAGTRKAQARRQPSLRVNAPMDFL